MAKSKQRKKYNPEKTRNNYFQSMARKCVLYRWQSSEHPEEAYEGLGPFPHQKSVSLLNWAMQRSETWTITVVGCFVDGPNSYYEESYTFPPLGPLKLIDAFAAVGDDVRIAVSAVKKAGNEKHFVDAVTLITLTSPSNTVKMESDDWIKKQAGHRADLILDLVKERA